MDATASLTAPPAAPVDRWAPVHLEGAPPAVHAVARDGLLVLGGTTAGVSSWSSACDAALRIPGVLAIADQTVAASASAPAPGSGPGPGPGPMGRTLVVARALHDLITDSRLDAEVLVECEGTRVTLWGRAADAATRSAITRCAWSVTGVRGVQNWMRSAA